MLLDEIDKQYLQVLQDMVCLDTCSLIENCIKNNEI